MLKIDFSKKIEVVIIVRAGSAQALSHFCHTIGTVLGIQQKSRTFAPIIECLTPRKCLLEKLQINSLRLYTNL